MICPKCGNPDVREHSRCRCGMWVKPGAVPSAPLRTAAETSPDALRVQTPGPDAWINMGAGLLIAVVVSQLKFPAFIFSQFGVLVHEMGHWIFGLLFAYPSVPTFDFMHGGGVTLHQERSAFVLVVIYLLWGALFFRFRQNRISLAVLAAGAACFAAAAHTRLHEYLILFFGHGFEVVIAGVFLYRAWSKSAIVTPLERPLYAALGFFGIGRTIAFAHGIMSDSFTRALYLEGKGGIENDFHRLSAFMRIHMNTLLGGLMLWAVLGLIVSFLSFRYQAYWTAAVRRFLETGRTDE